MSKYLRFDDNPETKTDDYLYKMAAWESMLSTLLGIALHGLSTLIPVIILFSNNSIEVKLASIGGGGIGNITSSVITRYNPRQQKRQKEELESTNPVNDAMTEALLPTSNEDIY